MGLRAQNNKKYLIQARVLWSGPFEYEIHCGYVAKCALIEVKSIRMLLILAPDSPLWEQGQSLLFQSELRLVDEELSGDDFFLFPFDLCEVFTQYQFISYTSSDMGSKMLISPVFKPLYMPYERPISYPSSENYIYRPGWTSFSECAVSAPGQRLVVGITPEFQTAQALSEARVLSGHLFAVLDAPLFYQALPETFYEHLYWNTHRVQAQVIDSIQLAHDILYLACCGPYQFIFSYQDLCWKNDPSYEGKESLLKPIPKGAFFQATMTLWLDQADDKAWPVGSYQVKTCEVMGVKNRPMARTYLQKQDTKGHPEMYFVELERQAE